MERIMPAEQLNIRIKLDTSELNAGVRLVKTKLNEIADAAKRNIPKIDTESNKASKSLMVVSKAGIEVKKTLENIGSKAKNNLSFITAEGSKVADAFQKMRVMGMAANTGMNVDGANTSLGELIDTLKSIARLDLIGAIAAQAGKILGIFKNLKKSILDCKDAFINYHKATKMSEDMTRAFVQTGFNPIGAGGIVDTLDWINEAMIKTKEKFKKSLRAIGIEVSKLHSIFTALGTAILAVLLPINTFSVSKMAREIDVAAERVGFSAQAYQEWTYVLNRAGIEASELVEVMKTLTEAQIDVVKGEKEYIAAFEKLGMTKEQVASMSQEQLWNATISALQIMEDATMRNMVAQRIFEEDMSKLTPLLNMTNQ